MRKSEILFSIDQATMKSDAFIDFCRNGNPYVFVRKRKMPLDDLLLSMINRKGLTLKLELRNYMKISHPGINVSKPSYLKQRMKLNPEWGNIEIVYLNPDKDYEETAIATDADTDKKAS